MTTLLCASPACTLPGIHRTDPDDDHDDITCRGCQPACAADGLWLCEHCTRRLARDATDAAALYAALGQVLAGSGGRGDGGPGGRSTGIELDPIAVEARGAIRGTLVGLCRLIAEERGIGLPRDDVAGMAAYVARHARWLAGHPAAGEHAQDLRDIASDGRSRRVAYAVPSDRTLIGLCNQPGSDADGDPGAVCGARIYVREPGEGIVCPGCGTTGTVQWWRWELCAAADGGEVVDAYAAAAYLANRWLREVQPGLVWQWGRRYPDAGLVRELVRDEHGELVEGKPVRDRGGRVLFVLGMLERRAAKMWGEAPDMLAKVGG